MAKAKIVESSAEFFSVLEKSGLLTSSTLESARSICAETDDPKAAARKLLSGGVITQWQASQLLVGYAGLVTGKYQLLDVLSKSDLGRVYLAEQIELKQKVALYVINTKNFADSKQLESFWSDIRLASNPEIRNQLRIIDVNSDQDRHILVTELAGDAKAPATIDELIAKLRSLNTVPAAIEKVEPEPVQLNETAQSDESTAESDDGVNESDDDANESDDDANVDAEAIPDEDLAGFKVKTKSRESLVAAVGGVPTVSADQLAKKQQTKMLLTIGGVAAALLILVTAGIVALMSAGGDQEVAKVDVPAATKQVPPPATDPYGGGPPIVAVDEGLSTVAPSSALSGLTATPVSAAANAVGSPAANIGTTTAAPTSPLPDPAASPVAVSAATASTPLPTTSTPPATPPGTTTAAAPTAAVPAAKTEPMPAASATPAATPEQKPEPAAPTNLEVKSEAKPDAPPPAKPAAPKPAARVFEIASAVDLPRLPAADGSVAESPARTLGRINAGPEAGCFISLLGGTSAMKGKTELAIRSGLGGTAPRDWEFVAREATDAETVLAKLSLPQDDLTFEWTPEGLQHAAAPHLRNCALQITVGQEKPYAVALRTPQSGVPAALGTLEKSPLNLRFEIEALPDPAAVRIEPKITEIKMAMEQPGAGEKTKGDQWIYLGEGGAQSLLHLRMATSTTAKGMQITLTPYLVLPQEKPQRLTPALRKALSVGALQEQQRMVENRIAELGKLPKERQKSGESDEMSVRKKLIDENLLKLQQLDAVLQKLASAQLQVRIYHDIPETPIDLLRTGN